MEENYHYYLWEGPFYYETPGIFRSNWKEFLVDRWDWETMDWKAMTSEWFAWTMTDPDSYHFIKTREEVEWVLGEFRKGQDAARKAVEFIICGVEIEDD